MSNRIPSNHQYELLFEGWLDTPEKEVYNGWEGGDLTSDTLGSGSSCVGCLQRVARAIHSIPYGHSKRRLLNFVDASRLAHEYEQAVKGVRNH